MVHKPEYSEVLLRGRGLVLLINHFSWNAHGSGLTPGTTKEGKYPTQSCVRGRGSGCPSSVCHSASCSTESELGCRAEQGAQVSGRSSTCTRATCRPQCLSDFCCPIPAVRREGFRSGTPVCLQQVTDIPA